MAQTMNYLSENNLLEYAVLEEKAAAATAHHNELSAQIKAAEKRMAEIAVLRTHIVNYAKTREVYVAYRKAGYSKKFREEHEEEILLHQAAKNAFDEMGVKKLPKGQRVTDGVREIAGRKEKRLIIYRGHGKMEYLCYSKKSDFLFKNVKIPLSYFYKILNDYFEAGEIDVYQKKLLDGISKVNITPYMEHIFAEIKDFTQYRGGLGYLFLESKVFELLSVYLSEVLELSILASTYVAISRSDRDSIIEAKRIIDSQLALAPSCGELARQVNISTSKLTKGFSSLFGTSVHAYIIDQRLEKRQAYC